MSCGISVFVKKIREGEIFDEIMVTNFLKFDMKTINPQIQQTPSRIRTHTQPTPRYSIIKSLKALKRKKIKPYVQRNKDKKFCRLFVMMKTVGQWNKHL